MYYLFGGGTGCAADLGRKSYDPTPPFNDLFEMCQESYDPPKYYVNSI